jgi:cobalt-zinc-cadmium efflux system outer membrane protein
MAHQPPLQPPAPIDIPRRTLYVPSVRPTPRSREKLRLFVALSMAFLCAAPCAAQAAPASPQTAPASAQAPPASTQAAPVPLERPIALREALDLAAKQNLDLAAARQRRAFALAGIQTARQIPNPNFTFSASRDAPHEAFLIIQPLELGGKRGRRMELARQEQALTDVEIAVVEREVRRQVREAYFAVAQARAETERRARMLTLVQRLLEIAQQRFSAGDVAQLEINQAQLEVARAEVDLGVARQQERVFNGRLSAVLNEAPETVWKPATSLDEMVGVPALQELMADAYQSNSELAHLQQELRVEVSHTNLLRAQRVPDLDLGAGLDLNAPRDYRVGARGQFGLNLPIFSRNQGELAQSSAQQRILEAVAAALRRTVAGRVEAAYYEWDARHAEVELYRSALRPAAARVEQQAEESYRAGKANLLTVLDAQRSVQEIEKNYLESLGALQSAFAALEQITGMRLD